MTPVASPRLLPGSRELMVLTLAARLLPAIAGSAQYAEATDSLLSDAALDLAEVFISQAEKRYGTLPPGTVL